MAVMSGKFQVWGDKVAVFFMHGRDLTDLDGKRREQLLIGSLGEEEGHRVSNLLSIPETPKHLRTGVTEPLTFWLPREVFMALVVRVYESLTPEQRDAYRGPTAWEQEDAKTQELDII